MKSTELGFLVLRSILSLRPPLRSGWLLHSPPGPSPISRLRRRHWRVDGAQPWGGIVLAAGLLIGCGTRWEESTQGHLRLLGLDTHSGRTGAAKLKFDVEPGESALLVTAQPAESLLAHVRFLVDPDRFAVFDASDWSEASVSKSTGAFLSKAPTLNWPIQGGDRDLHEGRWQVDLALVDDTEGVYVRDDVRVDILFKADSDLTRGSLPVHVVYAGGTDSDTALTTAVDTALQIWAGLYDQMGIELLLDGTSTYDDGELAPPAFGSDDAYRAISAGTGLGIVNIVVAPEIAMFEDVFGIAGDIPGPLVSSSKSGILLSAQLAAGTDGVFSDEEQRLLGETLAHEAGHYLGLFHPVEVEWDSWDSLDDTDECDREVPCINALADNLMFPFPVCGAFQCQPQDKITEDQAGVAHRYVGVD